MIVMKFGGTSVGSQENFVQVVKIIRQQAKQQTKRPGTIVVTSAMGGVTDKLIYSVHAAANGNEQPYHETKSELLMKHREVAESIIPNSKERASLNQIWEERLNEFERLCHSIAVLGELTARGLDVVSGIGEQLSSPLLAAAIRAQGSQSQLVDARKIIITDNNHGGANPNMSSIAKRCHEHLLQLIERDIIPVLGGFIASSEEGIPMTLGRGGSDYSATILGAALDADEIQIWTDVNGVMTADPRIVKNARSLPEVSYEEISELSYYGAKVLHAKSISPAMEKDIHLRVLNTFNPDYQGTSIVLRHKKSQHGVIKAVTGIRKMTLMTISGRGMLGVPGIAARTFSSVASVSANVLMISQSSSEHSICFIVPSSFAGIVLKSLEKEFERELEQRQVDNIKGQNDIVIVAVVGSGFKKTPGIAGKIFNALDQGKINVIALAQGASEVNFNLVVSENNANQAVQLIHDALDLEQPS